MCGFSSSDHQKTVWVAFLGSSQDSEWSLPQSALNWLLLRAWYLGCCWGTSSSLVAQQKRIHLQCRRLRFNPQVGKIPWRREWQPTPVFLPGEPHGQRSLAGYSPWGRKESDMTEWLTNNNWESLEMKVGEHQFSSWRVPLIWYFLTPQERRLEESLENSILQLLCQSMISYYYCY